MSREKHLNMKEVDTEELSVYEAANNISLVGEEREKVLLLKRTTMNSFNKLPNFLCIYRFNNNQLFLKNEFNYIRYCWRKFW